MSGENAEPGPAPAVPSAPTKKKKKPAKKRRRKLSRKQESRRQLLRAGLTALALGLLQPLAWIPIVRRFGERLRPPGALAERDFLGACIKCGQCVQVCPVQAIPFGSIEDGFGSSVPFVEPRAQACDFSCDALSCVLACPTGALSHEIQSKEEVHIGVARLTRPDACLARAGKPFRGVARGRQFTGRLRYEEIDRWHAIEVREHPYEREVCDLCVLECPIGRDALQLEPLLLASGEPDGRRMTRVVGDACVGCGVCQMICPEEPTCIVIDPTPSSGRRPARRGEQATEAA